MGCTWTRNTALFKIGTFLLLVALIGLSVGFAAPYWSSDANKICGLWQVCYSGSCDFTIGLGDPFDSAWFISTQALVSSGVGIVVVCNLIGFITLCNNCMSSSRAVSATIAAWTAIASVVITTGTVLFAVETLVSYPDDSLGFAFMTTAAAGGALLIPSALFAIDTCTGTRCANESTCEDKCEKEEEVNNCDCS